MMGFVFVYSKWGEFIRDVLRGGVDLCSSLLTLYKDRRLPGFFPSSFFFSFFFPFFIPCSDEWQYGRRYPFHTYYRDTGGGGGMGQRGKKYQ